MTTDPSNGVQGVETPAVGPQSNNRGSSPTSGTGSPERRQAEVRRVGSSPTSGTGSPERRQAEVRRVGSSPTSGTGSPERRQAEVRRVGSSPTSGTGCRWATAISTMHATTPISRFRTMQRGRASQPGSMRGQRANRTELRHDAECGFEMTIVSGPIREGTTLCVKCGRPGERDRCCRSS
jgi:hypothetical protein